MGSSTDRNIVIYPDKAQILKSLALSRLLRQTPVVTVDQDGIASNPIAFWFTNMKMFISWSEMRAMYLQELTLRGDGREKTYRFLSLLPKDIDAFAREQKLVKPGRFALLGIMAASETPFMIFEETIQPYPLDVLLAQISERFQDKFREHEIEIREVQRKTFR